MLQKWEKSVINKCGKSEFQDFTSKAQNQLILASFSDISQSNITLFASDFFLFTMQADRYFWFQNWIFSISVGEKLVCIVVAIIIKIQQLSLIESKNNIHYELTLAKKFNLAGQ